MYSFGGQATTSPHFLNFGASGNRVGGNFAVLDLENFKENIITSVDSAKTGLITSAGNTNDKVVSSVDSAAANLVHSVDNIKNKVKATVDGAATNLLTNVHNVKEKVSATVGSAASTILTNVGQATDKVVTKTEGIKNFTVGATNTTKGTLLSVFEGAKNRFIYKLKFKDTYDPIPVDAIRTSFPESTEQPDLMVDTTKNVLADEGYQTEKPWEEFLTIPGSRSTSDDEFLFPESRSAESDSDLFEVETTTMDVHSNLELDELAETREIVDASLAISTEVFIEFTTVSS